MLLAILSATTNHNHYPPLSMSGLSWLKEATPKNYLDREIVLISSDTSIIATVSEHFKSESNPLLV